MALSSLNTKNYEHSADNATNLISSISVDDIDTQSPLRVGYEYTIKNVFSGLNKIIKAILNRFKEIDKDTEGVSGSFAIPEHSSSTDTSWDISKEYTITNLKRKYTRGYFAFFCRDTNDNDINAFGTPSLWVENMGKVAFLSPTLSTADSSYRTEPFFVSTSGNYYIKLTNFEVKRVDNDIKININIHGARSSFSGYELRYYLF